MGGPDTTGFGPGRGLISGCCIVLTNSMGRTGPLRKDAPAARGRLDDPPACAVWRSGSRWWRYAWWSGYWRFASLGSWLMRYGTVQTVARQSRIHVRVLFWTTHRCPILYPPRDRTSNGRSKAAARSSPSRSTDARRGVGGIPRDDERVPLRRVSLASDEVVRTSWRLPINAFIDVPREDHRDCRPWYTRVNDAAIVAAVAANPDPAARLRAAGCSAVMSGEHRTCDNALANRKGATAVPP